MGKAIYFDMDGTIYDLYGVNGWLEMLQAEDETVYNCGKALYNMNELNDLMMKFVALGFTIGVITWASMNGSKEFNKRTRAIKKAWIEENLPCVSEFHCVKYGTPKHTVGKIKNSILIDDNAEVRAAWNGETINACEDIMKELKSLLAIFCKQWYHFSIKRKELKWKKQFTKLMMLQNLTIGTGNVRKFL